MYKNNLIALAGRKNSGKTTAGRYLETLGYVRCSFAKPLKDMLLAVGVPRCSLYGTNEEKDEIIPDLGVSGRHLMQTLGGQWGRDLVGENVWVNLLFMREATPFTVIDDLRYPNELEAVRSHGGTIIGIRRHEVFALNDPHSSESMIDGLNVDAWIENDGSLEQLYKDLDHLIKLSGHTGELVPA